MAWESLYFEVFMDDMADTDNRLSSMLFAIYSGK